MKKGLLVYRINRDDPSNIGVINKCKAQQKAFRAQGFSVDMIWLCQAGVLKNDSLLQKADIPPHSLKVYQFYFFRFGKMIAELVEAGSYDFIYLRHPFFDPLLAQSLRKIKETFPKIKIILEINTYPYDAEPKRLLHRLSLKMDQYYRKRAGEYIDRIVDYGLPDQIWGIPAINIRNGVAVDLIPVSRSVPQANLLRLIAVGNWSYWHGLDRLLRGLANYIQQGEKTKVTLRIVGDGPNAEAQKELAKNLDLENHIQFHPSTRGAALDALFEQADIGVGTLGLHRKGVALDSSLKHREYCSRGIPFLLAGHDLDFPNTLDFIHQVAENDQPIDILALTNWFSKAMKSKARAYAQAQLSWEHQLKPVFAYLEAYREFGH